MVIHSPLLTSHMVHLWMDLPLIALFISMRRLIIMSFLYKLKAYLWFSFE